MSAETKDVKPSVLSLAINRLSVLFNTYMPSIKNGGLFIPTKREYKLGDDVFIVVNLMGEEEKYSIKGKVIWITPPNAINNKAQGIGVQFPKDETGEALRLAIEGHLGKYLKADRRNLTM